MGVEGGAVAQGVFPAGLEGGFEILTHAAGGVGVQAAHAGDFVAQALLGEDLGDAIFSHPGLMAVPQAMGRETEADGQPAGERGGTGDGADAVTARRGEGLAAGAWWERGPGGDGGAGPVGGVGDDEPGGVARDGLVAAVAGGAEDAAGVVAAPVVAAVGAQEQVASAAAVLRGAGTLPAGLGLGWGLAGEQGVEEGWQVDGQAGFPGGAAVGVVFGWQAVEGGPDLA
ncbi:MAG TPA: hypothetical protein VKS82_11735 [Streptosporangiaceae bacterium]|nr:hypothetical protein [Streptosporangiaceae bacterium]